MILKGKARRFKQSDDINTDYVISGRYKFKIQDPVELAKHVMEDLDPDFATKRLQKGDFIVAGRNFGCGSSREQAPQAIKYAGISAVIAKSFARIFYRNAINIGLPILENKEAPDKINEGDEIEVDLASGIIKDIKTGSSFKAEAFPKFMQDLIQAGGLINYVKNKLRK